MEYFINGDETEKWNAYLYPGTVTLINKLNIKDNNELGRVERIVTEEKLKEIKDNPIDGNFDAKHLCDIHKYLFGDLYEWAGSYRNVMMRKEGYSPFAAVSDIEYFLERDFAMLKKNLRNVYNMETFANLLAEYYISFAKIHPFREGNGRTIREFLREFVMAKSVLMGMEPYTLDWDLIDNDKITKLMPLSFGTSTLIQMEIKKGLVPYINEKEKIK